MSEAKVDDLILDVKSLKTVFFTNSGLFKAVDDVSFNVRKGKTLAIVGESGCGKSVTALSIMRLVPNPPGKIVGDTVTLEGTELLGLDEEAMRDIRGNRMGLLVYWVAQALEKQYSLFTGQSGWQKIGRLPRSVFCLRLSPRIQRLTCATTCRCCAMQKR